MKKLILILLLLQALTSLSLAAEVKVSVQGMVCGFCAQGIEKKLKANPAIEKVEVSLNNHLVQFFLKPDQELSDNQIKKIMADAGYSVSWIERK